MGAWLLVRGDLLGGGRVLSMHNPNHLDLLRMSVGVVALSPAIIVTGHSLFPSFKPKISPPPSSLLCHIFSSFFCSFFFSQ
jgi:hypothetical protein